MAEADLVVTGEGHFDVQSAAGKGPSMVAELAARANVPVALVAGMVTAPTDDFRYACSLSDIAGSTAAAVADPKKWLRMAGTTLAGAFGHDRPDKADPCARGR